MFLQQGKVRAIKKLLASPAGGEVSFATDQDRDVWLGLGWLVGRGWAVFSGDYRFRLTALGRGLCSEYLKESA